MTPPNCVRCRERMEEGYMLDRGHANSARQAEWVEGAPQMQRVLGIGFGIHAPKERLHKVTVYRCPRCGLLESYALDVTSNS